MTLDHGTHNSSNKATMKCRYQTDRDQPVNLPSDKSHINQPCFGRACTPLWHPGSPPRPSPPAGLLNVPPTARHTPRPLRFCPHNQRRRPCLWAHPSPPQPPPTRATAAAATTAATTAVNAAATPAATAATATATAEPSISAGPSGPPVPSAPALPHAARGHAAAQQLPLRSRCYPERGDLLPLLPGRPIVADICDAPSGGLRCQGCSSGYRCNC